ncbi:MAG: hypothetical protein LBR87_09600 [Synergistaceae bacterium]|nr:hypothetical protein [Synergistaceae bacterium]
MKKLKALSVRHDEEIINAFMGIAATNGTSAAEVLRRCIEKYILEHKEDAARKLAGTGH